MQRRVVPDIVNSQKLTTFSPETTVRTAAAVMTERSIGAILIMKDEQLAGIFTERDLLRRVVGATRDPDTTSLEEVMTPDPDTLAPNATAMEALLLMRGRGYRHLPVLDKGKLIGIVSIRDLFAAVQEELEQDLQQRDALLFDTGYGTGAGG
ncbi:MAG: CBS domain-containing protein [Pseudomonadota bacterium]|uniref:CBS domain-containing protein n=1 Tax=Fodinicurvata fenggangensis TaxID=1121830 RepID=UPI00047D3F63|nr:CBS domain-containing protein [Fodinicurvata fenggangensis]